MIVLDASAALELLIRSPTGRVLEARLLAPGESLHAPHLLDLEVLQVLRRYVRKGEMSEGRAMDAIDDFRALPVNRYPHEPFSARVWELRDNLSAYDAVYVALAEALRAPLVTCDAALAAAPGHEASVELAHVT
jgi:predicted nucleic acid-binding protein